MFYREYLMIYCFWEFYIRGLNVLMRMFLVGVDWYVESCFYLMYLMIVEVFLFFIV